MAAMSNAERQRRYRERSRARVVSPRVARQLFVGQGKLICFLGEVSADLPRWQQEPAIGVARDWLDLAERGGERFHADDELKGRVLAALIKLKSRLEGQD